MYPLISIITVCYNAENSIEETIKSVISQSYSDIEYIIIDGGSTDSTVNIIKKYQNNIHYWNSEIDKGIYDAMNKGILKSHGDFIIFMNAGDCFVKKTTITECCKYINEHHNFDVYYGDTILNYSEKNQYISHPKDLNLLKKQMVFCHQSCLIKASIQKKYFFDLSYKLLADYNLFRNLYINGYSFSYINIPIAIYEAQKGVSSKMHKKVMMEYVKINNKNNRFIRIIKLFYVDIRFLIKQLIPQNIIKKIARYKQYS